MFLDENAALIEPRRGKRESPLPASALLVFTPQDVEVFLRFFSQPPQKSHSICLAQVYVGSHLGRSLALAGPAIGAPQAVMIVEKLIALGVREILAVGWCGSLQRQVRIGDIVLPGEAVCEEGTSPHYPIAAPNPTPSRELLFILREVMKRDRLPFHEGAVWSTDAPYRETIGKVLAYQRKRILAVDMETSALLTLGNFRGIQLAVVLVVSDDLSSLKWIHGFRDSAFRRSRETLATLALEAICSRA